VDRSLHNSDINLSPRNRSLVIRNRERFQRSTLRSHDQESITTAADYNSGRRMAWDRFRRMSKPHTREFQRGIPSRWRYSEDRAASVRVSADSRSPGSECCRVVVADNWMIRFFARFQTMIDVLFHTVPIAQTTRFGMWW